MVTRTTRDEWSISWIGIIVWAIFASMLGFAFSAGWTLGQMVCGR